MGIMCLLVAWFSKDRLLRNMSLAVATIHIPLTLDELTGHALFEDNKWQYPVAVVFLLLIASLTLLSKRDERRKDQ